MSHDNIQVAVRVRPLINAENRKRLRPQWSINGTNIYQIDESGQTASSEPYTFDHIFDPLKKNSDIFNNIVEDFVKSALQGLNSTIFAYGQTSSGKTYTMLGDDNDPGLMSLAADSIFDIIDNCKTRKFLVRVSYIEIYNETIIDLLGRNNACKIREALDGSVSITGAKEVLVWSKGEILQYLKEGTRNRKIGDTKMNSRSSRSHTLVRIFVESRSMTDESCFHIACLNLVDLAGSERVGQTNATGVRLKEGGHINKSLSALSLVIKQLSDGNEFVNFRDSKLTRILQNSLGGNSKTLVIATVTLTSIEDTHSTLAFAQRAKTVKNRPHINEVVSDATLSKHYEQMIKELTRRLQEQESMQKDTEHEKTKLLKQINMLENFRPLEVVQEGNAVNKRRHTMAFFTMSKPFRLQTIREKPELASTSKLTPNKGKENYFPATPEHLLRCRIDVLQKDLDELTSFTSLEQQCQYNPQKVQELEKTVAMYVQQYQELQTRTREENEFIVQQLTTKFKQRENELLSRISEIQSGNSLKHDLKYLKENMLKLQDVITEGDFFANKDTPSNNIVDKFSVKLQSSQKIIIDEILKQISSVNQNVLIPNDIQSFKDLMQEFSQCETEFSLASPMDEKILVQKDKLEILNFLVGTYEALLRKNELIGRFSEETRQLNDKIAASDKAIAELRVAKDQQILQLKEKIEETEVLLHKKDLELTEINKKYETFKSLQEEETQNSNEEIKRLKEDVEKKEAVIKSLQDKEYKVNSGHKEDIENLKKQLSDAKNVETSLSATIARKDLELIEINEKYDILKSLQDVEIKRLEIDVENKKSAIKSLQEKMVQVDSSHKEDIENLKKHARNVEISFGAAIESKEEKIANLNVEIKILEECLENRERVIKRLGDKECKVDSGSKEDVENLKRQLSNAEVMARNVEISLNATIRNLEKSMDRKDLELIDINKKYEVLKLLQEEEIENLNVKIRKLKGDAENKESVIKSLEDKLAVATKGDVQNLKKQLADKREQISRMRQQMEDADVSYENLKATFAKKTDDIDYSNKEDIEDLKKQLSDAKVNAKNISATIERKDLELIEVNKKYDVLKSLRKEEVENLNVEIKRLKIDIENKESAIKSLEEKMVQVDSSHKEDIEKLKKHARNVEMLIECKEEKIANLNLEINILEEDIENKESIIKSLGVKECKVDSGSKEDVGNLKRQLSNAEVMARNVEISLNATIRNLEKSMDRKDLELVDINTKYKVLKLLQEEEIENLNVKIRKLKDDAENKESVIKALEDKLAVVTEGDVQNLKKQVADKRQHISRMRQEIKDADVSYENLKATFADISRQYELLKTDLSIKDARLEQMEEKMKGAIDDVKTSQRSIEIKDREIMELEKKHEKLKAELEERIKTLLEQRHNLLMEVIKIENKSSDTTDLGALQKQLEEKELDLVEITKERNKIKLQIKTKTAEITTLKKELERRDVELLNLINDKNETENKFKEFVSIVLMQLIKDNKDLMLERVNPEYLNTINEELKYLVENFTAKRQSYLEELQRKVKESSQFFKEHSCRAVTFLQQKIDDLETQRSVYLTEIDSLKNSDCPKCAKLKECNDFLRNALKECRTEMFKNLDETTEQKSKMKEQIKTLEAKVGELQISIRIHKHKIEPEKKEVNSASTQCDIPDNDYKILLNKYDSAKAVCRMRQKQIDELKHKIEPEKKEVNSASTQCDIPDNDYKILLNKYDNAKAVCRMRQKQIDELNRKLSQFGDIRV